MKIKIFLNESTTQYGYGKHYVPVSRVEELFRFFHLSKNQLHKDAKTFTFNPRVPKTPFEDDDYKVIEDDFTPRISLAVKIQDAVDALEAEKDNKFYVYACDIESRLDDDIDAVPLTLQLDRCKEEINVGPEYGQQYKLNKFIDKYIDDIKKKFKTSPPHDSISTPRQFQDKLKKKWIGCVPDADLTNEYWSIKDTKMYYIGVYSAGDNMIKLSWQGKEILNKIENEESSS